MEALLNAQQWGKSHRVGERGDGWLKAAVPNGAMPLVLPIQTSLHDASLGSAHRVT